MTIDDLYDLALPEQPAAGPDGNIVYVLRTTDREADRDRHALWMLSRNGGDPVQLTRGSDDHAPAWSPDGRRIAFLRAADGPAQVWILPAGGGEPEQVTSLPLGAGTPVWSPDGTRLAFGAAVSPVEVKPEDAAPIVTDRLDFKSDGSGLIREIRKHLHVLDLDSREVRQITRGDWHAGDPAWSPDGSRLAFSAARDADADLTFRTSAYVVDAQQRNAEPELIGGSDWLIGPICWTPDGNELLAVGRTDTEVGHSRLLRIPLDGGEVVDLAAALDRNVMPGGPGYPGALPSFTNDGRSVVFCVRDRGYTHLYEVGLDGSAPKCLVGDANNVSGASVAGDTVAIVLGTPTSYGEVATVDRTSGAVTTWTSHGTTTERRFSHEEREFSISDGTVVHGWLLRDPDRTGPRPLLVDIHGGPHNAWNGAADPVHLYHQVLVERGWAVLLLNPRGSDGYGEAFFTAGVGGWGQSDAKDFLESVDQLVAEQVADPARLAVSGYSYGGFMTCYLTSHDPRFAAAVAGGGQRPDQHGRHLRRGALPQHQGARRHRLHRAVAVHAGSGGAHADADRAGCGRRALPGWSSRAVVRRVARAERSDPIGALPGRIAPVRPERQTVSSRRLEPADRRLGRAVRRRARSPATRPDQPGALAAAARRTRDRPPSARSDAGNPAARG